MPNPAPTLTCQLATLSKRLRKSGMPTEMRTRTRSLRRQDELSVGDDGAAREAEGRTRCRGRSTR